MSSISISIIVFASFFGCDSRNVSPDGFARVTPERRVENAVQAGTGLIGAMAALLLGLLVASAKSSFDTKNDELRQMAAKINFLDRVLANYGPETHETRERLRGSLTGMIDHVWPQQGSEPAQLDPTASNGESFYESLYQLTPRTDEQTALKAQTLGMAIDI